MDKLLLTKWLSKTASFKITDIDVLQELIDLYPYSQSIRLLYLNSLLFNQPETFNKELKKSAIYISDRKVLFNLLERVDKKLVEVEEGGIGSVRTESKEDDRTLDVIDTFLSSIPEDNVDYANLEVSSDYMGYLFEDGEEKSDDKHIPLEGQQLIDDFLNTDANSKKKSLDYQKDNSIVDSYCIDIEKENSEEDNDLEDSFFTETLAKIYIKQKRYSKALEILKKLSLKYPKKNTYFADQIRFLEKLIINAKSK